MWHGVIRKRHQPHLSVFLYCIHFLGQYTFLVNVVMNVVTTLFVKLSTIFNICCLQFYGKCHTQSNF